MSLKTRKLQRDKKYKAMDIKNVISYFLNNKKNSVRQISETLGLNPTYVNRILNDWIDNR